MQVITILYLTLGIALIWKASEALEKYSVLTAQNFNISPFIIGSTVIALGTSAPEIFTTLFAALKNQGNLIVGNVVGSNIANLSLVFGLTLFILGVKKKVIQEKSIELKWNLLTLISASIIMYVIFWIRPFAILSSIILISSLFLIITSWSMLSTPETEKKPPSKTAQKPDKNNGFVLGRKKPRPMPNTVILESSKNVGKTSKSRKKSPPWDQSARCAPQSGQDGSVGEPL